MTDTTERLLSILADHGKENPMHADALIVALGISRWVLLQHDTAWATKQRLSDMATLRRAHIQPARRWLRDHGLAGMLGSCHAGYYINATEQERATYRAIIAGQYGRKINETRPVQWDGNQSAMSL